MKEQGWRTELLSCRCPPGVRDALAKDASLEPLLYQQIESGKEHWPTLDVAPEVYLSHLATVVASPSVADPRQHLSAFVAMDVFLAAACLAGNVDAQNILLNENRPILRRALRKLGASPELCDEVEQRVFEKVLVGDAPQLAGYSGRGSLAGWIRMIGVRMCRRSLGGARRLAGEDRDLDGLAHSDADVELGYLKGRYREQFRDAFLAAAGDLTERQRNILRQQHQDGVSIDALASLYSVHRATAARWAAAARMTLLEGTKKRLTLEMGVDTKDFDSILRLVQSQLDVGIDTLLE